ncbi:MAG: MauE/DoxX family redox-associated membrane protein [Thermoanaerobaculia bacterium]
MNLLRALAHPWLTVRVQIALGLLFIAAALPKIVDPPSFAHMIFNYRIVPGFLVNGAALLLPWVELLAGLGLVLGIWRRSSSVLVGLLLLAFLFGIGLNLARGNPIICGCFDVHAAGWSAAQKFAAMRLDILRDLGMLLLVAQSLYGTYRIEKDSILHVGRRAA